MDKKMRKSGERALLEMWMEKMPQLRGCRKNSHVLIEMASELEKAGFKYTPEEVKTKMHNMTCRYRKEKLKIGTTGGSPSEWDLFKDMEYLLAPCKNYNPEGLVSDSINDIYSSIEPVSLSLPSPSPSPNNTLSPSQFTSELDSPSPAKLRMSAKRKKNNIEILIKSVAANLENVRNDFKGTSERFLAIEEEKKEILKSFAAK